MSSDLSWMFCEQILPDVSRSFALIIPQCPPPIDRAMCVAYLICRLADTVEDEPALTDPQRSHLYDALLGATDQPLDRHRSEVFMRLWPSIPAGDYGRLILGAPHVLAALASLPADYLPAIRTCVHDMIAGMRQVTAVETRHHVRFMCRNLTELDQYCHYVAGTVGIMSTALFETRFRAAGQMEVWREQGRRLGLGLQMTNIIKDCCGDARRGVSFVPSDYVDIVEATSRLNDLGRSELIAHAVTHLDAAMQYILAVPAAETGIRTFLLGSMLPAIATLEVAAPGDQLQPKISRAAMSEILTLIAEHVQNDPFLSHWYEQRRAHTLALAHALPQPVNLRDNPS